MAAASSSASLQRPLIVIGATILAVVIIACLYLAQAVFVPLALATLLAFMLSPLVNRLQNLGLGRIPSVLLVVVLAGLADGWGHAPGAHPRGGPHVAAFAGYVAL